MKAVWNFTKFCGSWIWKIVGAAAVVIGIIAAYFQFFSAPSVYSEIQSEVNVLDVRQSVADLQVLFRGNNIQEQNQNLKVYRIRLENDGRTDIRQNDFDQSDDWGIRVQSGNIIEARLTDTNSNYIRQNLNIRVENSLIRFDKVIFDKKDSFVIEMLVLHDKNKPPTLYRFGKIAGIQDDESRIFHAEVSESFFKALFYGALYGSWYLITLRFFIYFIASVALFITLMLVIMQIHQKRTESRQRPQPPQQPSH